MPFFSDPWNQWMSYPITYTNPYPTTFVSYDGDDVRNKYYMFQSRSRPSCPSNEELLLLVKERLEQLEELSAELDSKNQKIYELESKLDAMKRKECPHQSKEEKENKPQENNDVTEEKVCLNGLDDKVEHCPNGSEENESHQLNVDGESPTVETLIEPETYFKYPDAPYLIGHEPEEL